MILTLGQDRLDMGGDRNFAPDFGYFAVFDQKRLTLVTSRGTAQLLGQGQFLN